MSIHHHLSLRSVISNFIYVKRSELNISQEYLATILDITQSSYSKREKGYSEFSLSEIEIVAKELGMLLPEFFMKAFSYDKSIITMIENYIERISDQERVKMRKRLESEYLQTSNILASLIMMLNPFL